MIDYPHDDAAEIPATGVPDDIKYLSGRLDNVASLLKKLLNIVSGTAKQRTQIIFNVAGGALVSSVYQTTTRQHIDWLVFGAPAGANVDFRAGSARLFHNIGNSSDGAGLPVSFDLEPGIDYQFTSVGAAIFGAAGGTIWLIGTLEEG